MGIHGSITGKMMTRIMYRSYNNCYYSSSEPVIDEEDELKLQVEVNKIKAYSLKKKVIYTWYKSRS